MTRPGFLLALALLLPAAPGAPAEARESTFAVPPSPPDAVESVVTTCAGGAIIGALVFYAGTLGPVRLRTVPPGAALFCGLFVAASAFNAAGERLSRLVDHLLAAHHPAAPQALTPETVP